jgi:miniconductance mechanosensitive channel
MDITPLQQWLSQYPNLAQALTYIGVLLLIVISYLVAYRLVGRALIYFAGRTASKYDDIVIKRLKPARVSLYAPLFVIYYFAYLVPAAQEYILKGVLFVVLWLSVITFDALLDAANEIYESRRSFSGAAIAGYLDIVKILAYAVGVILSISLFTGESPVALLAGLGALTAVLLLIFRDTILSLVASVQISTNDLVREGDWLEVPAYNADGDVLDINLHQIKIQNWDKTISVVPTYKLLESSYKNWRGMSESGGRRIKRAIHIDLHSIRFCDDAMLENFRRFDLIRDYVSAKLENVSREMVERKVGKDDHIGVHHLTNVNVFRAYIQAYLQAHPSIRQDMTVLVRQLDPSPTGLPIEIYVFTKTTEWIEYEAIQAEIFDHLLAVVPEFDLRVFQEPSGSDFETLVRSI